ncbi:MAG: protein kinase [Polyangiales bacterium]
MSTDSDHGSSRCGACGSDAPVGARFCPGCGAVLAEGLRAATAPRDPYALADPLIGQVIADRYRVLAPLGRGGMGVVYRVEHVHIGKLMAMKLLSGELARDATTLARFEREAKAVSHLTHPNTVQIFDFGESERLAYLVMEYVPGRDLATLVADEGALSFERVARIGAQIAGSVEEAHQRGIIHRDIKPENVMVLDTSEQHDFVKVLDFGIAKLRDAEAGSLSTQKGHLVGTPYYMAPEQIRAGAIDHRVDVYALGGLMYKALTGVTPFSADTPMEVLGMHLNDPVVAPSVRVRELNIPREADRIIGRALSKDPERRYPSMAALREDLLNQLDGQSLTPPRASRQAPRVATRIDVESYEGTLKRRSRGYVFGALALVILLAVGGGVLYRGRILALLRPQPLSVEREPNDEPGDANLLGENLPLRAMQGKRRSATESDADVFRIALTTPRVVDLTVSALPNVDLLIELVEKGSSRPFLVVDSGKLGAAERIPNLTLQPGTYYARVRQPTAPGVYPVENVSDAYVVSLALGTPSPAGEHELNDGPEVAETLLPFVAREGLIGWAKDRDVYCAAPDAEARTVTLGGVPGLDLVLAYLDRTTDAGQRIDRAGVGEGETLSLPRATTPRRACFTVSARDGKDSAPADATHRYRIELR